MTQLPSERYLMQQIGGMVVLFERGTEDELLRFDPADAHACGLAQEVIHLSTRLSAEDKCFAHFWAGYFYAYSVTEFPPIEPNTAAKESRIRREVNNENPPVVAH